MKAECDDLKDREESLKKREKTLHSEMKKKGDLARQMLAEKDVYIQQLLSNNSNGSINNGNNNSASASYGSSGSSGATFILSNLDTAAPTHSAAASSGSDRSPNGSGQRPSGRPLPGSARPSEMSSSSSRVRERRCLHCCLSCRASLRVYVSSLCIA